MRGCLEGCRPHGSHCTRRRRLRPLVRAQERSPRSVDSEHTVGERQPVWPMELGDQWGLIGNPTRHEIIDPMLKAGAARSQEVAWWCAGASEAARFLGFTHFRMSACIFQVLRGWKRSEILCSRGRSSWPDFAVGGPAGITCLGHISRAASRSSIRFAIVAWEACQDCALHHLDGCGSCPLPSLISSGMLRCSALPFRLNFGAFCMENMLGALEWLR